MENLNDALRMGAAIMVFVCAITLLAMMESRFDRSLDLLQDEIQHGHAVTIMQAD